MKSVANQPNLPPQNATTTEAKGEAITKVPSENIKLSSEAMPFRNQKAGCQPCLSFLPPIQKKVSGIIDADQGQGQAPANDRMLKKTGRLSTKVIEADQYMVREVITTVRRDAVWALTFLKRFDNGIDVSGSQLLCDAINTINRAEVPL